jgi:energy-coupling factor transporter transmembrane protein EcfT
MGRGLLASLRLLSTFALGRLFYQATPSSELREAAARVGALLPGRLGEDLALLLSLVLGFIPAILLAWRHSEEAARARGLGRSGGGRGAGRRRGTGTGGLGLRRSLTLNLRVVEAFVRRLILDALLLPEILVARGWTGETRTAGRPWQPASWLALLGSGSLLAGSILGWL